MIQKYVGEKAQAAMKELEENARAIRAQGLIASIPPFEPDRDTLVCDTDGIDGSGRYAFWYVEFGAAA